MTLHRFWGHVLRTARESQGLSAVSSARLLQGAMSASSILAVETGRRRPPQKLSPQLLSLVGEAPSAQEQVYWDLIYAYRTSMLQLVLHTATAWEQKGMDAETWEGIWGPKSRSERFEWAVAAEDGLLVDWLLVATDGLHLDFAQPEPMEPELAQALPQSPAPGGLEILGLLRGHLRGGSDTEWVAVPLALALRN
ncbi:MAG: hypothetical protein M1596_01745 [Firmicutes bacterium]|nr:hypothetical protein [Bacillota bacterium]